MTGTPSGAHCRAKGAEIDLVNLSGPGPADQCIGYNVVRSLLVLNHQVAILYLQRPAHEPLFMIVHTRKEGQRIVVSVKYQW